MAFNFQFNFSVRIQNGFKVVSHKREVSEFLASRMGKISRRWASTSSLGRESIEVKLRNEVSPRPAILPCFEGALCTSLMPPSDLEVRSRVEK
jgi:hypothetical protein